MSVMRHTIETEVEMLKGIAMGIQIICISIVTGTLATQIMQAYDKLEEAQYYGFSENIDYATGQLVGHIVVFLAFLVTAVVGPIMFAHLYRCDEDDVADTDVNSASSASQS